MEMYPKETRAMDPTALRQMIVRQMRQIEKLMEEVDRLRNELNAARLRNES